MCSTFEVQCTSLTMYTVVNGSTVIVCKLNNVRYCTCIIHVHTVLATLQQSGVDTKIKAYL